MEKQTLLEKKQALENEIEKLELQLANQDIYIALQERQQELEKIDRQILDTDDDEGTQLKEYLLSQGYVAIPGAGEYFNHKLFDKLFDNYCVNIDFTVNEILIADLSNNEIITKYFNDYNEAKEFLEKLIIKPKVAVLTIKYPFVGIEDNEEYSIKTVNDLTDMWYNHGFYDFTDLELLNSTLVVE